MVAIRSRRARALALDGLVAVVAAVAVVVGSRFAARGLPGRPLDPLAYALMAVAVAALPARRVWPAATLAVTVAVGVAYLAAGYPPGPVFLTVAIAMYSLAARWPLRRSLVACVAALLALLAGHGGALPWLPRPGGVGELNGVAGEVGWAAAWTLLPWAVGTAVRSGRQEAVRAREEEAGRRVYEERLRIAREVHDVVGHGLAVINMQAGIALHVLGKRGGAGGRDDDEARAALEAIKATSKDALDELRGTLAVFRRPDGRPDSRPDADGAEGAAPRRPAPGLDQLEALVAEMAESGLDVELDVTGERPSLPGAVDLAAYRIVQESLTNVLRHARGAAATVRVGYSPAEVAIEVSDDGNGRPPAAARHGARDGAQDGARDRARGGGHGIAGMRERAAAVGGTLDAGPAADGGFRVLARLPVGARHR